MAVYTIGNMTVEVVYVPFIVVRVLMAPILPITCQRWAVGHGMKSVDSRSTPEYFLEYCVWSMGVEVGAGRSGADQEERGLFGRSALS